MENLTKKDLEILLNLVQEKKESIRKESLHDSELRNQEIELDFIMIKLDTQIKKIDSKLDYLIDKLER